MAKPLDKKAEQYSCPYCGDEDISARELSVSEGGTISRDVSCAGCEETFTEYFTFSHWECSE